jgi:hypothetical protein
MFRYGIDHLLSLFDHLRGPRVGPLDVFLDSLLSVPLVSGDHCHLVRSLKLMDADGVDSSVSRQVGVNSTSSEYRSLSDPSHFHDIRVNRQSGGITSSSGYVGFGGMVGANHDCGSAGACAAK